MPKTFKNTRSTVARSVALLALGSVAAVAAHAQISGPGLRGSGLYVGGSIGGGHYSDSIRGSGTDWADAPVGKGYVGYTITPYFALESGLVHFGHIDAPGGRVKGYGGFIDAVGMYPINTQVTLLGRVGANHVRMKAGSARDGGNSLKLGLGAQYALNTNLAVRGEWERYRLDVFGSKPEVDQFTVGVNYKF